MSYDNTPPSTGNTAPSMLWTRWVNLIAGILLFIAPWVFVYTFNATATKVAVGMS